MNRTGVHGLQVAVQLVGSTSHRQTTFFDIQHIGVTGFGRGLGMEIAIELNRGLPLQRNAISIAGLGRRRQITSAINVHKDFVNVLAFNQISLKSKRIPFF